jgi:hypothetical protein
VKLSTAALPIAKENGIVLELLVLASKAASTNVPNVAKSYWISIHLVRNESITFLTL